MIRRKLLYILFWISLTAAGQENAFQNGEKLNFTIRYGLLKGGEASVELVKSYHKGQMHWHATLLASTTGWTDKLFYIREHYESYFSPKTGLPVSALRDVEEGPKYKRYNKVYFNQPENYLESEATKRMDIPARTFDVVSVFYAMRNSVLQNIGQQKDTIHFNLYFDKKIYKMHVVYAGKETLKTNYGRIRCMKFIPLVVAGRVFDSKEDVTLWISDDRNLIPIRARMKLLVGSFRADLTGHKLLKFPLQTTD